ncbi:MULTISPECIES: ZIP family metal transporter [unclassified Halorhabdus]|uniref:ZIP family metal transporter n=1 Tax=unclassified Halorhabdus TaxID=2621901 RepID=UPI0023DC6EA3|nr:MULTISPECIES: ZIP family metal transporter [unclassified Halorhabdus]WEL18342.1 Putative divalent heavy-metal cations transporter [Halorhabdus sp. SVX81]WEL22228.1 Putative divalent heavy-metal cations transporter [Halorhabdus sp. BNX81]
MNIKPRKILNNIRQETLLGGVSTLSLVGLTILAVLTAQPEDNLEKLVVIAWVAFGAMAGGAAVGAMSKRSHPRGLVWGYGLASGAMIASAAAFLIPQAIGQHGKVGGFGIAAGILVGYNAHTIGHRLSHLDLPMDTTATELAAHALSAGLIIGIIYGQMPELGILLGLAIVSHKGPAGYAAARRQTLEGESALPLLLPSAGVGLTALPVAMLSLPSSATINAAIFGFASGVFLHVAMDFLPSCEVGGEIDQAAGITETSHELLDRLRVQSLFSTSLGGVAVVIAWLLVP